jgi:polyisoprenoid-binding protein YceI
MRTVLLLLILHMPLLARGDDLQRYVIDDERSWIRVLVYRAGLMSFLGHNHVIASTDISGTVQRGAELGDTVVEMSFPVRSLLVDSRELRDQEGEDFSARVSEKDIHGTQQNMLGHKVLDAENHAVILIRSTEVSGELDSLIITADLSIAGKLRSISFPASASLADDSITVSGTATVNHDDLGLKPFSAAFGTLKVHKEMTIRFEITAVIEP